MERQRLTEIVKKLIIMAYSLASLDLMGMIQERIPLDTEPWQQVALNATFFFLGISCLLVLWKTGILRKPKFHVSSDQWTGD